MKRLKIYWKIYQNRQTAQKRLSVGPWTDPHIYTHSLIEETYEVIEAIDQKKFWWVKKRIGWSPSSYCLHAVIAEEENSFTLKDVIDSITEKWSGATRTYSVTRRRRLSRSKKELGTHQNDWRKKIGRWCVPKEMPALLRHCAFRKKHRKWDLMEKEAWCLEKSWGGDAGTRRCRTTKTMHTRRRIWRFIVSLVNYPDYWGESGICTERIDWKVYHRFYHIEENSTARETHRRCSMKERMRLGCKEEIEKLPEI